jgi:ATP-dependent protease ClpP protease subunit
MTEQKLHVWCACARAQGKRAALRSATIMLRQPLQRLYSMQASDIDIYRKITRDKTATMVRRLRFGHWCLTFDPVVRVI